MRRRVLRLGEARRRLVKLEGVHPLLAVTEQGQVCQRALLDPQVEVVGKRLRRPSSRAAPLIHRKLCPSLHLCSAALAFSALTFLASGGEMSEMCPSASTCRGFTSWLSCHRASRWTEGGTEEGGERRVPTSHASRLRSGSPEGWRESRRGARSREKTSLSGTQVESRFIPEPAHARCQTLSSGGGIKKKPALILHSFPCPHAFALSSRLLSLPPPQSGAWMNKSLHLPSPRQLCSRSLYLFSPPPPAPIK